MKTPTSRPGDRFALLAQLAAQLKDGDLRQISRRDYGADADMHLAQLRHVADHLLIPDPLEWHPAEVLELTRWSEVPEGADREIAIQLHRQRAFSCATLLAASGAPHTVLESSSSTLIQLIESLSQLQLQSPMDREACDLLIWLIGSDADPHPSTLDLWGLGLLHFALALPEWDDDDLSRLIDWIMARDSGATDAGPKGHSHETGAWRLTQTHYDQLHFKWRQLGPILMARLSQRHGRHTVERVKYIADQLETADELEKE